MTAIRRGLLSELFAGVAAKQLTAVETISDRSNQHEFQGVQQFRDLFGLDDRKGISTRFVLLGDEQEGLSEDGFISWSNVRKGQLRQGKPRTPEYHLYYSDNPVTGIMREGDFLFLALRRDGSAMVIIAPSQSTMQNQLRWLFGLSEQGVLDFEFRDIAADCTSELDFAARYILDELGIDLEETETDRVDVLLDQFGFQFPEPEDFSSFARSTLPQINISSHPDDVLMTWIEQESLLARRLERHIVAEGIRTNFRADNLTSGAGFNAFSTAVQLRRRHSVAATLKSHLRTVLSACQLSYDENTDIVRVAGLLLSKPL